MKRRIFLAATAATAMGCAPTSPGTPKRSTLPPKTADVTRATLTDFEELQGELGFGAPAPLRHPGGGVVTWLPPLATTVERGGTLFRVDNEPVVLLYGELPLYRPLGRGLHGPDVTQLEENLKALGFGGFTAGGEFTAATESAVKRWQKSLGLAETGAVARERAICVPGAIRVAEHRVRVGDEAGGEVVSFTGTARLVTVSVAVQRQRIAVAGAGVQVKLPDGKVLAGRVDSVAQEAAQEDNGPPAVSVLVSVADQAALGGLQRSPVTVRFVADERRDVLTVPVAALVALAEGGYGLQLVEGESARYVAVETGLFAGGRVEIRAAGLQPGMKVGMPA